MKYLLDTHTFLWTLFDDDQLSPQAAVAIQDRANDIYVSVISFWEISLKYSIGKIALTGIAPDELPKIADEAGLQIAQISAEQAATFHKLPRLRHKDPFDRLIVWQAISAALTLLSRDKELWRYRKHGLLLSW